MTPPKTWEEYLLLAVAFLVVLLLIKPCVLKVLQTFRKRCCGCPCWHRWLPCRNHEAAPAHEQVIRNEDLEALSRNIDAKVDAAISAANQRYNDAEEATKQNAKDLHNSVETSFVKVAELVLLHDGDLKRSKERVQALQEENDQLRLNHAKAGERHANEIQNERAKGQRDLDANREELTRKIKEKEHEIDEKTSMIQQLTKNNTNNMSRVIGKHGKQLREVGEDRDEKNRQLDDAKAERDKLREWAKDVNDTIADLLTTTDIKVFVNRLTALSERRPSAAPRARAAPPPPGEGGLYDA